MGMSHANCTHPRTPAGRAACRKQTSEFNVAVGKEPTEPVKPARKPRGTTTTDTAPKTAQRGSGMPLRGRRAFIRAEHDMGYHAVPHAFANVIRHAWAQDWPVLVGEQYNDTEKRIEIKSDAGYGTLIWRHTTPNGVHGCAFRPVDTSIMSKVPTVNELIRKLEGE